MVFRSNTTVAVMPRRKRITLRKIGKFNIGELSFFFSNPTSLHFRCFHMFLSESICIQRGGSVKWEVGRGIAVRQYLTKRLSANGRTNRRSINAQGKNESFRCDSSGERRYTSTNAFLYIWKRSWNPIDLRLQFDRFGKCLSGPKKIERSCRKLDIWLEIIECNQFSPFFTDD